MCGIVGTNSTLFNHEEVLTSIKHRGLDNQAFIISEKLYLGHTRLSIIDLNEEANQPMFFDEIYLTFNGEIYNYKELIVTHKLSCKTSSDSEVLIRLYQKYGSDFLHYLEGMFSFCIYDKNTKKFFCARDRFGKKPFYYYMHNDTFYFASEIKAILKMLGKTPPLNQEALWQYLAFQSPQGSNTFYQGIKKLPAGFCLTFENNQLTTSKYYSIDNIEILHTNEKKILTDVEALLHSSVDKRLVSDVEVATLLSGGLDSSFVTALYAQKSRHKVHTFSIGYEEHTRYCELKYAKDASAYLGTVHHEYTINKNDYLESLDKALEHLDEPMADSAIIPTYLLSKEIHNKGFKVCLSGEGSDEIFLGYDKYFDILKYYQQHPQQVEEFNFSKEWEYNRRRINNEQVYQSYGETFSLLQLQKLASVPLPTVLQPYNSNYSPEQWLSYIDFSIWIPEVLMSKIDRASMAHSLELRTPFLDHTLVEYLMGVDVTIKKGLTTKSILKKIARAYLPDAIIDRQKKGFSSPFIEWIYAGYGDEILKLMLDVNEELAIFNNDFIIFLYEEGKNGNYKQHVYSLFLFCKWYKKVYM